MNDNSLKMNHAMPRDITTLVFKQTLIMENHDQIASVLALPQLQINESMLIFAQFCLKIENFSKKQRGFIHSRKF